MVYGLSILPPVIAALVMGEQHTLRPLIAAACIFTAAGFIARHFTSPGTYTVHPRINYMAVIFTWLALILMTGGVYSACISDIAFIDALFDAAASLTATGISSSDISLLPYSLQLWHSILNWLGGIGIILITASLFAGRGFRGTGVISAEIPGPEFLTSSAAFRNTYRLIINVYAALTAVHFVLLLIARMPASAALLTALSNISTAGLLHISGGVITGQSLAVRIIITIFALMGSINISFFIMLLTRRTVSGSRIMENIMYISRILITAAVISAVIILTDHTPAAKAAGESLMQTVSFLSTSGYIVADCGSWPLLCQALIVLQIFLGGCAVSTAGGIKQARMEIGLRTVSFGLFRYSHPKAVRPLRFGRDTIKPEQLVQANIFIFLFMLIYILSALVISLDNKNESILDALNYSQAMLTNTGRAFAGSGVLSAEFSPLSKLVMCFEMLCGRLEIFPVLMLFFKSFWKPDRSR